MRETQDDGAADAQQPPRPGPVGAGEKEAGRPAPASPADDVSTDTPAAEGHQMSSADGELDALFRDFFRATGPMSQAPRAVWRPPTDVFETADEVVVKMEVAGVSKEDLKVTFEEGSLRIRGRRDERFDGKKIAVSQMEVEYGVFERNIAIRQAVDSDSIEASYNDGFLMVRIPKRKRPQDGGPVTIM